MRDGFLKDFWADASSLTYFLPLSFLPLEPGPREV